MRRLPIGIENFREIQEAGYYYVDKSKLIEQLLTAGGKVSLFTRPRRFGKTLNMSMLRCFFEVGTDPSLFDGLYISENRTLCETYLGKFPVICLSLKSVEGRTFGDAYETLRLLLREEVRRLRFLQESSRIPEDEKLSLRRILAERETQEDVQDGLRMLSSLLYKHYAKKVVILIDEYDVPLDKSFQNGYYQEMTNLIRLFLGNALKTNDNLEMAVLTGCLRITKESIFTGLNNFAVFSIADRRFDEQFGFTEEEVRKLLGFYHMENHLEDIKRWYDGYRFGNVDIYCPWDVINFAALLREDPDAAPQSYWINTSGNELVRRFIDKADKTTRDEIEYLVAGGSIEKQLRLELTYDEIDKNINNLWSILYTTGYLTLEGRSESNLYKLKIPNEEVRNVFALQIQEWFRETVLSNTERLTALWSAMEAADAKTMETSLTRMLIDSISVRDTGKADTKNENSYHMFLTGVLAGNADWSVKSNIEAGKGYADIIVKPDDPDTGMIFELKVASGINDMEKVCQEAIAQIKEKRYAEYLADEGRHNVLMYGIAFYKKRCKVMVETEEKSW